MKYSLNFLAIIFIFLCSGNNLNAQEIVKEKEPEMPKLSYGAKLNLINIVYNPFFFPDNAVFFKYPSPALIVKDFRNNTHEIEIQEFTFNRYSKDVYFNDIAVLYQYDARLSKAKNLKIMPMAAPYIILGFASQGGSDSILGRFYSNELYAKLGLGLGARFNVNERTFIDVIPSLKLTHFYWLSGRSASNPEPKTFDTNQLIKFEFKDIFFKVGLGHWF